MRRIALVLLASIALAGPASGQWRLAGLDGQAIGAVAVDPSNGSILYAASFQRIWKSVDGGGVWTRSDTGYTGDAAVGIAGALRALGFELGRAPKAILQVELRDQVA